MSSTLPTVSHILVTSASRLLHHDFQVSTKPKTQEKENAWNVLTKTDVWSALTSSLYKSLTFPHKPRMQILSSSSTLYVTVTFRTNPPSKCLSFSFYFSPSFLYITSEPSHRLVLLKAQRVEESYHNLKNQSWIKAEVTQNRGFQLLPKAQYTQKNERYAFMPISCSYVTWWLWGGLCLVAEKVEAKGIESECLWILSCLVIWGFEKCWRWYWVWLCGRSGLELGLTL